VSVLCVVLCASAALVLGYVAASGGAGTTDEISAAAALCWVVGSVLALLAFALFRGSNAARQTNRMYVEPSWRPMLVATTAAVIGLAAGTYGAFLVAEAVARR
jgi:hypothetical protein